MGQRAAQRLGADLPNARHHALVGRDRGDVGPHEATPDHTEPLDRTGLGRASVAVLDGLLLELVRAQEQADETARGLTHGELGEGRGLERERLLLGQ